jgi:hypothetical protein
MERGRAVSVIYRPACTAPPIFETHDEGQRQCMGLEYRQRKQGKDWRSANSDAETREREKCAK